MEHVKNMGTNKMSNDHSAVRYAEHCAEMAAEASSKSEEKHWWKQYREAMVSATGDVNLFRKKRTPTSRPSSALMRTMKKCRCDAKAIRWSRQNKKYEMKCGHDSGWSGRYTGTGNEIYEERTCQCGVESPKQRVGKIVMFSCSCGKKTAWHFSNSEARDEWNKIQGL